MVKIIVRIIIEFLRVCLQFYVRSSKVLKHRDRVILTCRSKTSK